MPDVSALHPGYDGAAVPIFESSARTTDPDSVVLHNKNGSHALVVVIDVTAASATPSMTLNIDGYDPVSGKAWTLLDATAVTGTGTTTAIVSPDLTASAGAIAKTVVPAYLRFSAVHADADSITYTVSAHLVD